MTVVYSDPIFMELRFFRTHVTTNVTVYRTGGDACLSVFKGELALHICSAHSLRVPPSGFGALQTKCKNVRGKCFGGAALCKPTAPESFCPPQCPSYRPKSRCSDHTRSSHLRRQCLQNPPHIHQDPHSQR